MHLSCVICSFPGHKHWLLGKEVEGMDLWKEGISIREEDIIFKVMPINHALASGMLTLTIGHGFGAKFCIIS